MKLSLLLTAALCVSHSALGQTPAAKPKPAPTALPADLLASLAAHPDLTYARYGEREMQLDLYRPKDAGEKLPAIVCIHGGGWSGHR